MYFDELSKLKRNDSTCKEFKFSNKNIDDKKAKDIFQALSTNTFCTKVILTDNSITDSSLSIICESLLKNKTIESIELEGNQFTSKGIDQFIKGLNKNTSLTDVTISEIATDAQLDDIDDVLDRNFEEKKKKKSEIKKEEPKTPTKVETKVTPTKVEAKVVSKVEPKVEIKPKVETKPLEIPEIEKLKKNDAFLKEVKLSKKNIDDKVGKELFAALLKNTFCTKLVLKDNLLTDVIVTNICDLLQQNTTLQDLNLEDNSFTSYGIDQMIKSLEKNYSLKDFKISKASNSQLDKIDDILDRNFDYKPESNKSTPKSSTPIQKEPVKDSPKIKIDSKVYEPVKQTTPTTPSGKKEIIVEKTEDGTRRRVKRVTKSPETPKLEKNEIKTSPDPIAMEKYLKEKREVEEKKEQLKKKIEELEKQKKQEEERAKKEMKDFKPLEFSREEIEKTMQYLAIAEESERSKKK